MRILLIYLIQHGSTVEYLTEDYDIALEKLKEYQECNKGIEFSLESHVVGMDDTAKSGKTYLEVH